MARFNNEPIKATLTMGMRSASEWKRSTMAPALALSTSEPRPTTKRKPFAAVKKVQTLCRRAKSRLDQAIAPCTPAASSLAASSLDGKGRTGVVVTRKLRGGELLFGLDSTYLRFLRRSSELHRAVARPRFQLLEQ